jgi:catechol 2,3-dioxygenase-like lactoylglutathione lyase family enzyme
MERFIAGLVKDFEAGKITRRQVCEGVALAAAVFGFGDAAKAAPARGLKILGVNHISYSCPDYAKARDFYTKTLGMEVHNDNKKDRANLAFGPDPGKGGAFLVTRNFGANQSRTAGQSAVDHVCYTVANWNQDRVVNGLKAAGATIGTSREGSVNVYDPNNYQCQIASINGENPFI